METNKSIVLRKATMEDAELLFRWKNDPDTIANSITKRGVTMEEHVNWLQKVMENSNRQLFILEVEQIPVGQLRLDLAVLEEDNSQSQKNMPAITAEISYGLGVEYRGKGLGRVLLEQAESLVWLLNLKELTAEVLPHNMASQKLFRSLGFVEEQKDDIYVYRKLYE